MLWKHFRSRLSCLILLSYPFVSLALRAGDESYLGTWKIASASIAPWWTDKAHEPDASETKSLVGKIVIIKAKSIEGPRQVACRAPKYKMLDYPADMLFQGMFGEMHERDKSIDPGKVASQVGFRGSRWKTLETGCGNELDYHFLDAGTASFGLNNYIYILKKQ